MRIPIYELLSSAGGLKKSLLTKPKSSSMVTQWLTSRNSASPVFSAVQDCRNVSSKPLLWKPEVSACRMRPCDISDAEIQITSSSNLRKSSASLAHPQSAVGCNAQQCWPMRLSGYHRLWFRFLVCTIGLHLEWPHCSGNFVQFHNDFTGLGAVAGMLLQCTFKSYCHSVFIQAGVKFFHICSNNVRHWFLLCSF